MSIGRAIVNSFWIIGCFACLLYFKQPIYLGAALLGLVGNL